MKKLLCMVIAVVMMLSMGVVAFADGETGTFNPGDALPNNPAPGGNNFPPLFNPAPAEDPVIIDLDGSDEAETEEANPNTGALVLVPAVVALAAVTGIMVSKRK